MYLFVDELMLIEAEGRLGAEKGKHSKDRTTYFSGGPNVEDRYALGDLLSQTAILALSSDNTAGRNTRPAQPGPLRL